MSALPAMLLACAIAAGAVPETLTATASARKGTTSLSTGVTVTITRHSSAEEREKVEKAIRAGGGLGLHNVLYGFPDVGTITVGDRRTPLKYAAERPTDTGRLITVVTADPMFYLGGGSPDAKSRAGYEVGVAMLVVEGAGGGTGELVPAARVGLNKDGSLLIQDYGDTVLSLKDITVAKSKS
jgi:hypothetical protein